MKYPSYAWPHEDRYDQAPAPVSFMLPIRTESVLNKREHWSKRASRAKLERRAMLALTPRGIKLPATVTLTRIAPRPMDSDNLAASFKACRDGIADQFGVNDRDPRIEWRYMQERGRPKQYAVKVQITNG